jgi:hypothetical protein
MLGTSSDGENPLGMPLFWVGGMIMTLFPTLEIGGTVRCMEGPTTGGVIVGAVSRNLNAGLLPRARARVGLGMSETFGMYSWGPSPHTRPSDLHPLSLFAPGVDVKVVDETGAVSVTENEVRSSSAVEASRWASTRSKDAGLDADGYYRTGDEGEVDGAVIYFLGRLGDMIKTSGANVAPAESSELLDIDGSRRPRGCHRRCRAGRSSAPVVLEAGVGLDAKDILEVLRARLSSYKVRGSSPSSIRTRFPSHRRTRSASPPGRADPFPRLFDLELSRARASVSAGLDELEPFPSGSSTTA